MRTGRKANVRWGTFWVVVFGLIMGLTSCADGGDDSSSGEGSAVGDEVPEGAALASGALIAEGAQVPGPQRDVVYTADLVVRVDDVEAAAATARDLVDAVDGYVGQQSATLEGDRRATITLRVPAADFEEVLDGLADLGEVLSRELASDDVTDQVVDLQVRIANSQASAERLRELLGQAENLVNIVALEDELTTRVTEIEQMTGQLQVLEAEVAYSTVTVRLTEERPSEPEVADDLPGFVRSFRAGLVAVANVGLVILAVVGFVLPFVPFVAAGWFGWRTYRRRHPKPPKNPLLPPPTWPAAAPGAPAWVPPPPPSGASPEAPDGVVDGGTGSPPEPPPPGSDDPEP